MSIALLAGGGLNVLAFWNYGRALALEELSLVLPLVIVFLFASSSISYVAVMIKVASMGQQANVQASRAMGRNIR